jgi:hypothetical protein
MNDSLFLYLILISIIGIIYYLDSNLFMGLYYELMLIGLKIRQLPLQFKFYVQLQLDKYRIKKLIQRHKKSSFSK